MAAGCFGCHIDIEPPGLDRMVVRTLGLTVVPSDNNTSLKEMMLDRKCVLRLKIACMHWDNIEIVLSE